jgi:hypothetical protein
VQTEVIATGVVTVIDAADYTITGLGEVTGGSVTYPKVGDPLASTVKITVYRAVPVTQGIGVSNQTAYNAGVVEKVWDRLTLIAQDQAEEIDRSVKMPITFDGTTPNLPAPVEGKVIQWENNLLINGPTAAQIAAANAEAVAAAASASAAAGSATTAGTKAAEAAASAASVAVGTGVTSGYTASVVIGGTDFTVSAVSGTINSVDGIATIAYAGAADVAVGDVTQNSAYVYLDNAGVLQQQFSIPTRDDWSRKIFLLRIAMDPSTDTIVGFEYLNNPTTDIPNTIRDLHKALLAQGVPFKEGQTVTGRASLGFNVGGGTSLELGGTGLIFNPNLVYLDALDDAEFFLSTRTDFDVGGNTALPKFWDNAGTLTPLGSTTWVGHRLYRFSSGNIVLQYGQGNYANLSLARSGVVLENYEINPQLLNATFFGWWFIESTATTTDGAAANFVEYTIGIQGGSNGGLAGCVLKGNNGSDFLDAPTVLINLGVPALIAATAIGVGQTWQDMSASRNSNLTVYQNTTGKPIQVNINFSGDFNSAYFEVSINNSTWVRIYADNGDGAPVPMNGVIIPDDHYYRSSTSGGTNDPDWFELR